MCAAVLALSLATVVLTGCSSPDAADEATSHEAVSSAVSTEGASTGEAVGTVADDAPVDGGGSSAGSGSDTGITSSQQDDLEAELAAIERELDAMALPDDTDFSDIEGALQ